MFTIMGHGGMEPQDRNLDLDLADSDCDCDSVTGINMKLSSIHLGEPRDQRLIKMYMSVGRQKGSGQGRMWVWLESKSYERFINFKLINGLCECCPCRR